jgi:FkbM family methyltransferase
VSAEEPPKKLSSIASKEDIQYCFRLLWGREPEAWEWPGHSGFIGQDLSKVVSTYINAEEFRNRHLLNAVPQGVAQVDLSTFSMFVSPEDTFIGQQLLHTKSYEDHVSRIFRERLAPGMAVLDIGANIGYFSLLAASIVGAAGKVFAFEPSADNVRLLAASKALNAFEQVTIIAAAATDILGTYVYLPSLSNGFVRDAAGLSPASILSAVMVFGARIDDLLAEDTKIDFIKIDVEGFEYKALHGARNLILRNRPLIVSEFSPTSLGSSSGVSGKTYLNFLDALGYELSVIGETTTTPATVDKVLEYFAASGSDHIDILAEPRAVVTGKAQKADAD